MRRDYLVPMRYVCRSLVCLNPGVRKYFGGGGIPPLGFLAIVSTRLPRSLQRGGTVLSFSSVLSHSDCCTRRLEVKHLSKLSCAVIVLTRLPRTTSSPCERRERWGWGQG